MEQASETTVCIDIATLIFAGDPTEVTNPMCYQTTVPEF